MIWLYLWIYCLKDVEVTNVITTIFGHLIYIISGITRLEMSWRHKVVARQCSYVMYVHFKFIRFTLVYIASYQLHSNSITAYQIGNCRSNFLFGFYMHPWHNATIFYSDGYIKIHAIYMYISA